MKITSIVISAGFILLFSGINVVNAGIFDDVIPCADAGNCEQKGKKQNRPVGDLEDAKESLGSDEIDSNELTQCSVREVRDLRKRCLEILKDIAGTVDLGEQVAKKAAKHYWKFVEKSYECGKDTYKLFKNIAELIAVIKTTKNPLKIAELAKEITENAKGIYENCKQAVEEYLKFKEEKRKADFILGTAQVSWDDQGGGEIEKRLIECTDSSDCITTLKALNQKAKDIRDALNEMEKDADERYKEVQKSMRYLECVMNNPNNPLPCNPPPEPKPLPGPVSVPGLN